MSKNNYSDIPEEKLSHKEFCQLIPHLELNQLFKIEINLLGKWQKLFEVTYLEGAPTELKCIACEQIVPLESFKEHIRQVSHLERLQTIKMFYHPSFTSERDRFEKSTEDSTEKAKQGNKNFPQPMKSDKTNYQDDAIASEIEYRNLLGSNALKAVHANVSLPYNELLLLQFMKRKGGKWQSMIVLEGDKHHCMICGRYSVGLKPINDHLAGKAHRRMQEDVFAVRLSKYSHLTKYCVFNHKEKYSLKLNSAKAASFKGNRTSFKALETPVRDFKTADAEKSDEGQSDSKNLTVTPSAEVLLPAIASKVKQLTAKDISIPIDEGLIGVEYVVKFSDFTLRYSCALCENCSDATEIGMEGHITSFQHRSAYCKLYYPDTIEEFKRIISNTKVPYSIAMNEVLAKIAYGVENYHGYGTPHSIPKSKFIMNREQVLEKLHGLPHANQNFGPSFSNVLSLREISELLKNTHGKEKREKTKSHARFATPNPKKFYLNMRFHCSRPTKKTATDKFDQSRHTILSKVHRDKVSNGNKSYSRSISPRRAPLKRAISSSSNAADDKSDIWQIYRNKISKAAAEVESAYVKYRQYPEKHPFYDKEWNFFWKRRKEELVSEGKDHRSYNFQPEWASYFRQRLEKLFGEDLQKCKIDVRQQLNIPLNVEEDSQLAYKIDQVSYKKTRIEKPSRALIESCAEKAWKADNVSQSSEECLSITPIRTNNDQQTVIHMLRLMTALEDHLGSLGPKILDLLTKTLALEKYYSDSLEIEQKILTASNCKLLETAIEKLKSVLYADLVDGNKINSFKRTIKCTENLLSRAEKMGWRTITEEIPESSESGDIKKLLKILQDRKPDVHLPGKKSLSDTLMEVMSQTKEHTICDEPKIKQISNAQFNMGVTTSRSTLNLKPWEVEKPSKSFDNFSGAYVPQMQNNNNTNYMWPSHNTNNIADAYEGSRNNLGELNFGNTPRNLFWNRTSGNVNNQPYNPTNFINPTMNAYSYDGNFENNNMWPGK